MPPKRGRPPKDEAAKKSIHVGIRVTPALRERLEEERRKAQPERSLSQEIALRLEASFGDYGAAQEKFGGPTSYWIFRTITDQIASIERETGARWWEDRYTFDECLALVVEIFSALRPAGRRVTPAHMKGYPLGKRRALIAISLLQQAASGMKGIKMPDAAFAAAGPILGKIGTRRMKQIKDEVMK